MMRYNVSMALSVSHRGFCRWFCLSLSLPTGMLPLNSFFPSINDIETVVLLLLSILGFFWVGFSYVVTTGWMFWDQLTWESNQSKRNRCRIWTLSRHHAVLVYNKMYEYTPRKASSVKKESVRPLLDTSWPTTQVVRVLREGNELDASEFKFFLLLYPLRGKWNCCLLYTSPSPRDA